MDGDGDHQGEHIEGEDAARTAGEDYVEGGKDGGDGSREAA